MKTNLTISLPIAVAQKLEEARGNSPRSVFISNVLESALNKKTGGSQ